VIPVLEIHIFAGFKSLYKVCIYSLTPSVSTYDIIEFDDDVDNKLYVERVLDEALLDIVMVISSVLSVGVSLLLFLKTRLDSNPCCLSIQLQKRK
jgi:hypothetical protein